MSPTKSFPSLSPGEMNPLVQKHMEIMLKDTTGIKLKNFALPMLNAKKY